MTTENKETTAATFEITDGVISDITAHDGWTLIYYEDDNDRHVDTLLAASWKLDQSPWHDLRRALNRAEIQHESGIEEDGPGCAAWTLIKTADLARSIERFE